MLGLRRVLSRFGALPLILKPQATLVRAASESASARREEDASLLNNQLFLRTAKELARYRRLHDHHSLIGTSKGSVRKFQSRSIVEEEEEEAVPLSMEYWEVEFPPLTEISRDTSSMSRRYPSAAKAILYCERHGWTWVLQDDLHTVRTNKLGPCAHVSKGKRRNQAANSYF